MASPRMRKSRKIVPAEASSLKEAIDALRVYSGVVLLSFARHGLGLQDTIARNFMARGMKCTQSIFDVWNAGSEQDAWILHRALIDRLLHLHHLAVTDTFTQFDDFSFRAMYVARSRLFQNSEFRERIPQAILDHHASQKHRYEDLLASASGPQWRRPNARHAADNMGLGFLYDLGYDYASMHVHPMSDDGARDFEVLTQADQENVLPDATVVRNSILIQTLIVQEALNASQLRWRAIVYDFLTQTREYLASSNSQYRDTMYKIGKIWTSGQLCEATGAQTQTHDNSGRSAGPNA